uniref:Uncharacterized protein n=1 Tax=viral metagenome TaxID=1070528 RepID=A0A6M3MB30_9ZZZZ
MTNRDALIAGVRTTRALDEAAKCRRPERVKTELYRSVPGRAKALGETGLKQKGNIDMRSRVLIIPLLAIMLFAPIAVFAVTELDVDWDGAGGFSVDFDTGDAYMGFSTGGAYIEGHLYANDYDDNPYSYGVDTFLTNVDAYVENGYIQYGVDRLDSTGMYGPADQSTFSYIGASDWASMTFQTRTNFADLDSSNYGFQANDHFLAEGVYGAYHEVLNGANIAWFDASGIGTLDIDHMTDDTWTTAIQFGKGCGCYTNADVTQDGSGTFVLGAHYENSFTMGGMTASGPVDYHQSILFGDGFSWSDYSFSGN